MLYKCVQKFFDISPTAQKHSARFCCTLCPTCPRHFMKCPLFLDTYCNTTLLEVVNYSKLLQTTLLFSTSSTVGIEAIIFLCLFLSLDSFFDWVQLSSFLFNISATSSSLLLPGLSLFPLCTNYLSLCCSAFFAYARYF